MLAERPRVDRGHLHLRREPAGKGSIRCARRRATQDKTFTFAIVLVSTMIVGAATATVLQVRRMQARAKTLNFATRGKIGGMKLALPPKCYTGTADATLTVEPTSQGSLFGSVDSGNADFANDTNPYYTVDITIPASYKQPSYMTGIKIYGSLRDWYQLTHSASACPNASLVWAVYKKGSNHGTTTWTLVTGESKKGEWVNHYDPDVSPYCDSGGSLRVDIPTPESKLGKETLYRVMIEPKFRGADRAAMVGWQWDY